MKVRSLVELRDALDTEVAWRRKELSGVRLLISSEKLRYAHGFACRSAILVAYAHWEGFTKRALSAYHEYVHRQGLRYRDLSTPFVALACRAAIRQTAQSSAAHLYTQLIDFLLLNDSDKARLPYEDVVNTRDNLSSGVLRDLLLQCGLPYTDELALQEKRLDTQLLKVRNSIAHGGGDSVDPEDAMLMLEFVDRLISLVTTLIENGASTGAYRRQSVPTGSTLGRDNSGLSMGSAS
jgi:hypothetical protein